MNIPARGAGEEAGQVLKSVVRNTCGQSLVRTLQVLESYLRILGVINLQGYSSGEAVAETD